MPHFLMESNYSRQVMPLDQLNEIAIRGQAMAEAETTGHVRNQTQNPLNEKQKVP